jgi:hypothetical protein
MNRDTVVTLNDLTSSASVEKVCENINKHAACETLDLLASQYRRSLKLGGGSINLTKMVAVIGDGITARELEEWLLNN